MTSILAPAIALLGLVVASAPSQASEAGLSGNEGSMLRRTISSYRLAARRSPSVSASASTLEDNITANARS
jgi:hypothetical protein